MKDWIAHELDEVRAALAAGPGWEPSTEDDFELLRHMSVQTLGQLGLGRYTDDEPPLMLFPGHWHARIPVGFEVEVISGRKQRWDETCDNDTRGGCLAYGIRAAR